jgi:hypothetical protein
MCFGQCLTWVTNYYAIKLILSYDRCNPSILRLQMQFMCWEMVIKHKNDHFLTDVNYWSHLGAYLTFDHLLQAYIKQVQVWICNPSPTSLIPAPKNMPYFRGPRLPVLLPPATTNHLKGDASIDYSAYAAHVSALSGEPILDLQHRSNIPVCFGNLLALLVSHTTSTHLLYNSKIMLAASILAIFD